MPRTSAVYAPPPQQREKASKVITIPFSLKKMMPQYEHSTKMRRYVVKILTSTPTLIHFSCRTFWRVKN